MVSLMSPSAATPLPSAAMREPDAPALHVPRRASVVGSRRWVFTLAAMTGVTALSIDMSLPAQPTLARVFDVTADTAQLNLSLFMIGFALAQLVMGYASDVWGRRRVLIGGLALYTLAALACAAAPTIEVVLACRVLQGIGASAAPVVARAMVRDTQPAAAAARLMSTMLATLALAPMLAPTLGGALLAAFGWRAVFAALAVSGGILLVLAHQTLSETLTHDRRLQASPGGLIRGYRTFFTTPGTRLPMLISCTSFAGQFAYIAVSPFVLMQGYGASTQAFGIYFGSTALALMLGSIGGSRMLRAGRSLRGMILLGTSLILVGAVLITIGTRVPGFGIAGFLAPMILYFFGVGLASPSASALALEPVAHIAGTASAAIGFLTMISGALAGYLTALVGGSDPRMFAVVVTVMGAAAAALGLAVARHPRPPR